MSEIKFRRDTSFRNLLFTADSFAHPAKMDAQLLIWIVEKYTRVGETILDPMAGMGTTMLACMLGRHCILVELEQKFVGMAKANWEKVKMMPQPGYAMGECQIIQGDARNLEGLLMDKCVFSPPYAGDKGREKGILVDDSDGIFQGRSYRPCATYSDNDNNISNLPYGNIDSIITSPPYEGTTGEGKEIGSEGHATGAFHYGNDADQIGNLKGDTYLSAMLQVYQQCHKVLKPQGLMILVTKNFIRNKKEVHLDEDTIKLCEQAGFQFVERHYRKLTSQSFWRVIYQQKYPDAPVLDKEDILVFRRELLCE